MKTDSGDTYSSFSRTFVVVVVAFCIVWLWISFYKCSEKETTKTSEKKIV